MRPMMKRFGPWCLLGLLATGCGNGGGGTDQPGALEPGGAGAALAQVADGQGNAVPASLSNAVDINDDNEVVGFAATTAGGGFTAARWTVNATGQGTINPKALSPLAGHASSAAFAIDGQGNAVGMSGNDAHKMAVIWKEGAAGPESLPALGPSGDSLALGVSPDGRKIVGEAFDATTGTTRAVLWRVASDGTVAAPQVLPTNPFVKFTPQGSLPVAYSSASAVSDGGVIVGEVEDGDGVLHAAVWEPGAGTSFNPIDLRRGTEKGSSARAVDSSGRVVGESENQAGASAPVLWAKNGQGTYVRTALAPSGVAADLNADGLIAGWSTEGDRETAVVWIEGEPVGSATLYPAGSRALAINGSNMVVGRNGSTGFVKKIR